MRLSCPLLLCLLSVFSVLTCSAQAFVSDKTVRTQVLKVKLSPSDIERAAAAEDLFDLVKGKNLDRVDSQTIHMINGLLDHDSLGATMWIAATLGEFRGRASFAAPRLIEILRKNECRRLDSSPVFTIRTALKKMGDNVPARECSK